VLHLVEALDHLPHLGSELGLGLRDLVERVRQACQLGFGLLADILGRLADILGRLAQVLHGPAQFFLNLPALFCQLAPRLSGVPCLLLGLPAGFRDLPLHLSLCPRAFGLLSLAFPILAAPPISLHALLLRAAVGAGSPRLAISFAPVTHVSCTAIGGSRHTIRHMGGKGSWVSPDHGPTVFRLEKVH
jgi:hypothetical protein